MMNYEIFKEVVKEKFMDYMPDNFKGMELVVMPVEKVNMTYDGISIRGKDTNISPTIYINDMYKKYQNCGDLEETLMAAGDLMIRALAQKPPVVDADSLYRDANEKVVFQLVNTEQNRSFLEQVPHREFQDLSIIYKVVVNVDDRGISYLNNERGISKAVIELFLKENLIYESRHYHNIVFKGNDKNGVTRFASMRGVFDKQGKPFKCDVEGNDKNYGFNVVNVNSTELVVFEAAIDLMSYVDIFADHESNKLALGMLADAPLATFLREHPQISFIRFCLDGDSPGRKAAAELMGKYYGLGYEVEDCPPPAGYKDYNEWLVATKLNLADQKKEQMTIAGQCH